MRKMSYYVVEKQFEYKGFNCLVVFNSGAYRCGYVGVPKSSKLYGMRYGHLTGIEVHGGVTFSGNLNGTEFENDGLWYFGFDCIHISDRYDFVQARKYFPERFRMYEMMMRVPYIDSESTIKYADFVESECKKFVDQLAERRDK